MLAEQKEYLVSKYWQGLDQPRTQPSNFIGQFSQTQTSTGRAPDFIGLGVAKSGTSWLYKNLGQHPEIAFAKAKRDNVFCYPLETCEQLESADNVDIGEIHYWATTTWISS